MKSAGIILAAGRGTRLGELTADVPKGLLEVGGVSLIERQVKCLSKYGIRRVHVVTGYEHEKVAECLNTNENNRCETNCVYNERWNSANNIYSLYVGKDFVDEGFVMINSDDIFHPEILKKLIDAPVPDAIVVDDHKKLGDEEMKVKLDDKGNLTEINKTMDPESSRGEYIGIAKFGPEGARELFEVLVEFVDRDELGGWYEEAFGVLSGRRAIKAVSTGGLPWTEIDTPEDLEKAEKEIWPKILKLVKGSGG